MGKERFSPNTSFTPRTDGYFLECRKDAQCDCSMCEASIHATLDLRPSNNLFNDITNRVDSASLDHSSSPFKMRGKENRWPDWEAADTRILTPHLTDPRRLIKGLQLKQDTDSMKRGKLAGYKRRGWQLLFLALLVEFVCPWAISRLYEPALSAENVRQLAEESMVRRRLVDRLDFVERKVSRAVPSASVSNCTGPESSWRLVEDGLFLHSYCDAYSSWIERVTVWGYPRKTGGVLGRAFVDRSFTILSGRVLEWQEGQIEYVVRPEGSSWTIPKWAASVILLDANTWILEYKRSAFSQSFGSFTGLLHLTKCGVRNIFRNVKASLDTVFFAPVQTIRWKDSNSLPT